MIELLLIIMYSVVAFDSIVRIYAEGANIVVAIMVGVFWLPLMLVGVIILWVEVMREDICKYGE